MNRDNGANENKRLVRNGLRLALKLVGGGSLLLLGAVAPGAVSAAASILAKRAGIPETKAKRALRYAVDQGLIVLNDTPSGVELALSRAGRIRWQKIDLESPLPARRWDGYWRLVIFDIPNRQRLARDAFRDKLKRLGLRQLQESVWITPYPCKQEINSLSQLYNLEQYIRLIEVRRLEDEATWLAKFALK